MSEDTVIDSDSVNIDEPYPESVPKWRTLFTAILDEWSGYCTSLDSAVGLIREYLKPYLSKTRFYLKKTHHLNFGKTEIPKKVIIQWDDKVQNPSIIPYDGAPFIYLNMKIWACHVGFSKCQSFAAKVEGGCPAQIVMKEVLKFPDYQVREDNDTSRALSMERLKRDFSFRTAQGERRFYIRLPSPSHHMNHTSESDQFMWSPVNKEVMRKMRELIEEGCETVEELQKRIYSFVRNEMPFGTDISDHNRSYFPTISAIKKAMVAYKREEGNRNLSRKRGLDKVTATFSSDLESHGSPSKRAHISSIESFVPEISVDTMINVVPSSSSCVDSYLAGTSEQRDRAQTTPLSPASWQKRIRSCMTTLLQAVSCVKDEEVLMGIHAKLSESIDMAQECQRRQLKDGWSIHRYHDSDRLNSSRQRKSQVDDSIKPQTSFQSPKTVIPVSFASSLREGSDFEDSPKTFSVSDIVYMSPEDVERMESTSNSDTIVSAYDDYGSETTEDVYVCDDANSYISYFHEETKKQ